MRSSVVEQMNRVKTLLIENERMTSEQLSEKTRLSRSSIGRIMKRLNASGIPVYSSTKGYILAEYASKRDDVHFFRVANGYFASSSNRLTAAYKYIRQRWKSQKESALLADMTKPINTSDMAIKRANKAIVSCVNSLGL